MPDFRDTRATLARQVRRHSFPDGRYVLRDDDCCRARHSEPCRGRFQRGIVMHRLLVAGTALLIVNSLTAERLVAQTPSPSCALRPVLMENFDEETAPNRHIETIAS